MRLTKPGATKGAWLALGRAAAGTVLVAVAVSACSVFGSSPSTYSPTPQTGALAPQSGTPRVSSAGRVPSRAVASPKASATVRRSASASHSPHSPASVTTSAPSSPSASPKVTTVPPTTPRAPQSSAPANTAFPTTAPQTGGGGTAGLQDGVLLGAGLAAVLAGLGSLGYRRRLARKLKANESPRDGDPANR